MGLCAGLPDRADGSVRGRLDAIGQVPQGGAHAQEHTDPRHTLAVAPRSPARLEALFLLSRPARRRTSAGLVRHHRAALRGLVARSGIAQKPRYNSSLAVQKEEELVGDSVLHGRDRSHHASIQGPSLSPIQQYHKLVESGSLRTDDHQERIIQKLQRLHDDLLHYEPHGIIHTPSSNSLISRLFTRQLGAAPVVLPENVPKGLYLYGDVGTGKTMLMDLFYNTLPPHIKKKRRVHFHAFMIDVHKRIHAMKAKLGLRGGDPIEPVARDLAQEAYVLCFDEFQVTDIADAMILRQLFEKLLNFGVVSVITSNRHPDELYKNGIQRQSFIPCIEILKERFEVTDLDSGTDYRRIPRTLSHVYYDPLTPENRAEIDKLFKAFASHSEDSVIRNRKLHVWGREVVIPESSSTVAKIGFLDLCGKPMSAADYIEITKNFGTIFVTDVPKMGLSQKDMARRFITFIDACYESKTKLFVSSEVPIYQIFADDPNAKSGEISDHMRSVMDDLGLSPDIVGTSSMFTGDEELFAFARCCSRLVQMGSKEWAETAGAR